MWKMGAGLVAASKAIAMPRCAEEKEVRDTEEGIPACSTNIYSTAKERRGRRGEDRRGERW
jgi:hypothetical protein